MFILRDRKLCELVIKLQRRIQESCSIGGEGDGGVVGFRMFWKWQKRVAWLVESVIGGPCPSGLSQYVF